MASDREQLRATFDSAAQHYQQARPDYPDALYEELLRLAALRPGAHLLEIGCATGKATLPLARRGFRITCLEIGEGLARAARQNLAAFPGSEIVEAAFETWRPAVDQKFDLVYAANAWHWLDPGVRYRRARELLRPGGHLALWNALHVFPAGGDPFFRGIQAVYDEIGEGIPPGAPWHPPGGLPDDRAEIEGSGLFTGTAIRHFDWGTQVRRRRVHPAARHVLQPYLHGPVAAGPAVRRDPAPPGAAAGRDPAPPLGLRAASCPPGGRCRGTRVSQRVRPPVRGGQRRRNMASRPTRPGALP